MSKRHLNHFVSNVSERFFRSALVVRQGCQPATWSAGPWPPRMPYVWIPFLSSVFRCPRSSPKSVLRCRCLVVLWCPRCSSTSVLRNCSLVVVRVLLSRCLKNQLMRLVASRSHRNKKTGKLCAWEIAWLNANAVRTGVTYYSSCYWSGSQYYSGCYVFTSAQYYSSYYGFSARNYSGCVYHVY